MDNSSEEHLEDSQLQRDLLSHAPRPSEAHNAAVLHAAHAAVRKRSRWRQPVLALAASLSLGIAITVLLVQNQLTDEPLSRGGESVALYPLDNASLNDPPRELRWKRNSAGSAVVVTLFDDTASEVWSSQRVSDDRVDLPDSLELGSGSRYFWMLRDATNSELTEGPFWFSIQ